MIIDAVAFTTEVSFRIPWLSLAGSLVQLGTLALLVWRLDAALPKSGAITPLVATAGIAGALLGPVALVGARVVRDLGPLLPISVGLVGLWLIGLGRMTVRLPAPLPRRAIVGGIGYLLVAAWFVLAATPLGWPLLVVGGLCCVSVLGLVFGLIDLDRLLPPASA